MSHYPPNWEDRPRVKPWNAQVTPEFLSTLSRDDLVSRIGLLQMQLTTERQDRLDARNLHNWEKHQLIEAIGEAGRVYSRLLAGKRHGRKSMRLSELFDEVIT